MTEQNLTGADRIARNPAITKLIILQLVLVIGICALRMAGMIEVEGNYLVDFHAFHITGVMYWDGYLYDAYDFDAMMEFQDREFGYKSFMPWTYPPQFNLVTAALGAMPISISYLVFIVTTLLVYMMVLAKLSGEYTPGVFFVVCPLVAIMVLVGQNGFVTGGLVGLFALLALRQSAHAGWPLGLMVIKPHLAVGLAVFVLVTRRWGIVLTAALAVILSSALATLVFGAGIWTAFLGGVEQARGFLEEGRYPLFRMTSLYAALYQFGVPAGLAMAVQIVTAVAALGVIAVTALKMRSTRLALGVAIFGTLMISPYNYDYDLTIFGVAIALVIADVSVRATLAEKLLLTGLGWFTMLWGIIVNLNKLEDGPNGEWMFAIPPYALSGLSYLAFVALIAVVLRRAAQPFGDGVQQAA